MSTGKEMPFIPTYDEHGNPAGVFDFQPMLDAAHDATKSAVKNLDASRGQMIHDVLDAARQVNVDSQTFVLAGTIADLLEMFQGIADIAETTGTPVRKALRDIWGLEDEGTDS